MSPVYVGTCSWADHADFYPAGLPANQQIGYYAQHFPLVEIDSTFYSIMPERNFGLWAQRTPPGFVFDVKPYRQITWHDREHPPTRESTGAFSQTLQPLRDARKLGAIHAQFPPWYMFQTRNVDYLGELRERFAGDRLGVEFRHRSWYEGDNLPATLERLRSLQIGLTVVDEPQIGSGSVPTLLEVTNPGLAIVRFHGRNAKMWYARVKTTGERFNYLYPPDELAEWVPSIAALGQHAGEIHVLFNNNAQDYAVQNARQLRLMLSSALAGGDVVAPPSDSVLANSR